MAHLRRNKLSCDILCYFYYLFEPEERIGLSASFLPRKRSTTELLRHHFSKLFFFNPAINLSRDRKIPTQIPQWHLLLCGQGGICTPEGLRPVGLQPTQFVYFCTCPLILYTNMRLSKFTVFDLPIMRSLWSPRSDLH